TKDTPTHIAAKTHLSHTQTHNIFMCAPTQIFTQCCCTLRCASTHTHTHTHTHIDITHTHTHTYNTTHISHTHTHTHITPHTYNTTHTHTHTRATGGKTITKKNPYAHQ